jgi:soluble lytic murein transglycosylase-like protein
MGDCKDNMKSTSEKTESFLDKFKKSIVSKKKKPKKETKTLVDLLAEVSDSVVRLRVNQNTESAEQFVAVLDEASTRSDKLVSVKEKDLDSETSKFEENIQKLSILKEIRYHIDEAVELAVLHSESKNNKNEILKQISYHIGEAAELSLNYSEAA